MPLSIADDLALTPEPTKNEARETAEQAAERLGVTVEAVKKLRATLGVHFDEIASTEATEDGTVVHVGAVEMVWRNRENPDANGNVGWLYLRRPDGRTDDDKDAPAYRTPTFVKPRPTHVAASRTKKKTT